MQIFALFIFSSCVSFLLVDVYPVFKVLFMDNIINLSELKKTASETICAAPIPHLPGNKSLDSQDAPDVFSLEIAQGNSGKNKGIIIPKENLNLGSSYLKTFSCYFIIIDFFCIFKSSFHKGHNPHKDCSQKKQQ